MATALEKEMANLLNISNEVEVGVKDAQKTTTKLRRRSKELQQTFEEMPSAAKWAGLTTLLGDDTSDEAIMKLFRDIDADSSKTIEKIELFHKFKAMAEMNSKPLSDDVINADVKNMFNDALKAGLIQDSEKITEDEFLVMIKQQLRKQQTK